MQSEKSLITFFLILISAFRFASAQIDEGKDKVQNQIIESEKKAFLQKQALSKKPDIEYGYDLTYQRIKWKLDPAKNYIEGAIHSRFTATHEGLTQVIFDKGELLHVDSVTYHGQNLTAEEPGNETVVIMLPKGLNSGARDSLTLFYHGKPITEDRSIVKITHANVPVMWTLSEPFGAKRWWPCKQTLRDKIDSIDIFATVLDTYKVGSNGLLVDSFRKNSFITYHWKHRYPIATYLISVAVTNYASFSLYADLGNGDSLEILNYVYPEDLKIAKEKYQYTIPVMQLYRKLVGEYPFVKEKYGHCHFGFGGGMEHQTMSYMGGFQPELIAHELAHQWFGDKVTCGSWRDIWLNEGFATYMTGLTLKYLDSEKAWNEWKSSKIASITEEPGGSVYVDDSTSVARIFSGRLSYNKGAYLLHMLRCELGDNAFFSGLKSYLSDTNLAYGFARTSDLQKHLELAADTNLDEFFKDWFYGQGYPNYTLEWKPLENGKISLKIFQTPSDPSVDFYEMKVPVLFKNNEQQKLFTFQNTYSGQEFVVDVPFKVSDVIFDPEMNILALSKVRRGFSDKLKSSIIIYPNPAKDYITVTYKTFCEKLTFLKIYDSKGNIVFKEEINTFMPPFGSYNFSIQSLNSGFYFLQVFCKDSSETVLFNKR